ncbi:MAG: hypothetical protein Q8922_11675 [Bacteroidota bacterium]|nr:hypothetical protein [Bacteroidota bacterium]MDP4234659.1 hypothetical protein [Bacteroidota bacterium]MDP4288585.1 hypothetical protein [Bacteroidota bacterium]
MTRLTMILFLGLLTVALCAAAPNAVRAQQGGSPTNQISSPTAPQESLADSIRRAEAENEALTRILSSIEVIDTARQSELIQWIITDRTIRSRVISALRKGGYRIAPNSVAEMTVTQKPPINDNDMALLRLVIDTIKVFGEPKLHQIFGSDQGSLYEKINSRDGYEYTLISTEPSQQKVQFVAMDASLFGGDIIFKSGFGFGINVGDDYIGYPFWLPGTIGTYGIIRRGTTDFRLGIEWPLGNSGVQPFVLSQGLQIRERKLTGAMAFAAEVKQDLGLLSEQSGKLHFGLEFRNSFTPNLSNFPDYATQPQYRTGSGGISTRGAIDSLYYLAISTHAYLSYRLPDQMFRGAYVQVGGGMHGIQPVTVGAAPANPKDPNNTDLNIVDRKDFWEPFIKLGYVHSSDAGDEYGVSVQYSNELLTDAWVKLFSWLQIEAKYATVIGRDPYPWEWKDYVMVSPKLTLNF